MEKSAALASVKLDAAMGQTLTGVICVVEYSDAYST